MALTDQVIMPGSDYQAICDATRSLTGKTGNLKSGDISTELGTIGIVEQATPSLTLNAATGVVTAEATQAAGLVAAGTKKATTQLATQAAKTVTPTEAEQTAVASGKYTTGDVVVAAVPTTYVGSGVARKSSSDLTADGATVNVPAGYYKNAASKSVATTTQATPNITVNSSGLITASATQSAGYVSAGTKSATRQLPIQPPTTITPSSLAQTAVPQGRYTTGAVTVAEIPKSYIGPLAPSANCAAILANVSTSVGTLSGITLSLTRRLSTYGNSNIANKVIEQDDEYVDETSVTVPTEEKTITPHWTASSSASSYSATGGKLIRRVVVNKPSTLISSNIKNGVEISGITGTYTGDDVFIREVSTKTSTTSAGAITFTTSRLARYLCIRTIYGDSYVASADIRSISSWRSIGDLYLDITYKGSTYHYTWNLFRSEDPNYDGANMTVYIIYDSL
jgi:hypothetical protein